MSEDFDKWFDAVLRLNRRPAWLSGDAPHHDVAVSSRARLMRNLAGFPFPGRCAPRRLEKVQSLVRHELMLSPGPLPPGDGRAGGAHSPNRPKTAATDSLPIFEERKNVSQAERAMLVGSRLVSPEFLWEAPGRSVFLNADRSVAIMVNEEDHLRIQCVTAGLSPETAQLTTQDSERALAKSLEFAQDHEFGYMAASPYNAGEGLRVGVMLHMPALTAERRVSTILETLRKRGFEVRGLLGERSTGLGAYVQISTTRRTAGELILSVRHLIDREREARIRLSPAWIATAVESALQRTWAKDGLSLAGATRLLGRLRLGALRGLLDRHPRGLDALLALVCYGDPDKPSANRRRAHLVRRYLELTLEWIPA